MSDIDDLRERVAEACRVLARLDLTKAATGHVSARVPGQDRALIRARGPNELGVRYTTAREVIAVDFDGKVAESTAEGLASPAEVFIHTAVYKARPDVMSVVHVHPAMVVLFTICDKPLLPLFGAYDPAALQLALEGVPTFDRSILVSTPELGADLVKAMGNARTCMMRGHGITTAGQSVEDAALSAIHLNELATINYQANLLGNPRPISEEDQATFRRGVLAPRGDRGPGRGPALWRYYVNLTRN
ncbi:MAG TPA: class II aldolase/adducin family protein [Stellaceae bacterium]|nr:class II aldolase/adducin family protein [Stellaceae bacterium]